MLKTILESSPIIPVIAIDDAQDACAIAEGFIKANIHNIEIVLRTPAALQSIRNISVQFKDIILGAGTVLNVEQAKHAIDAGVHYIVSPGFSAAVYEVCTLAHIPYLPGAVTPTEIQKAIDRGFSYLKFFPAEAMGGIETLKSYISVFPDIQFCATGGVKAHNARDYLLLPNVVSIGTSALLTSNIQSEKDWSKIAALKKDM